MKQIICLVLLVMLAKAANEKATNTYKHTGEISGTLGVCKPVALYTAGIANGERFYCDLAKHLWTWA